MILASARDECARRLAEQWQSVDARVLTPRDLSLPGWRYYSESTRSRVAVISGCVVPVREIRGVVTRLPCISPSELEHIVPDDRVYVAAEMTGFLTAWLSSLQCTLLNRPTPCCLYGPGWRQKHWVHAAYRAGIPVAERQGEARPAATVIIVGRRWIGDAALAELARRLADTAGVDLLAVQFSNSLFVSADPFPSTLDGDVADAILAHLCG